MPARRGHRRARRLPPARSPGAAPRLTTVAYCAVSPGGRVQRHTLVMDDAHRRRPAPAHRRRARRGRAGRRPSSATPASSPTPGRTAARPSPRRPASATPAMGHGQGRHARRSSTRSWPTSSAPPGSPPRPASTPSRSTSGTTTCSARSSAPTSTSAATSYGGSIENRARFPRRVVEAVRSTVGPRRPRRRPGQVQHGRRRRPRACGSTRALPIARLLEADGHLDAIELTGGSSLLNGMYFFRGDVPMQEFAATQPKVVGLGPAGVRAAGSSPSCRSRRPSSSRSPGSSATRCRCR